MGVPLVLSALLLFALVPSSSAADTDLSANEHLEFADGLFARGLYDMALDEYRKMEQAGGTNAPLDALLLRMGEAHRRLGDKVAAETAYRRLMDTFPSSPLRDKAEFRRAELFVAAGRFEEAERFLGELIARDPPKETLASARYFQGYSREKQGDVEGALKSYRSVVEDHPASPYVGYACLAAALLLEDAGGDDGEAMRYLEQAAAAQPSDRVAAEALFILGGAAYSRGLYDRSAAAYHELLTKYPGDRRIAEAGLKAGWAYERAGRHEEALALVLSRVGDAAAAHPEAWLYLKANGERNLGELDAATATYDDLLTRFPDGALADAAAYERVLVAYEQGRHEAVLDLGQVLAEAPSAGADLCWMLADSAETLGRIDLATNFYARTAERFPDTKRAPVALFRGARLTDAAGNAAGASRLYRLLDARYGDHPLAAEALYASATIHTAAGSADEALADWRALAERPDFARMEEVLFQKGLAEIRTEQPEAATASFQHFLAKHPEGARAIEAYYWLGVLLDESGDSDGAEAALNKVLATAPEGQLGLRSRYRLAGILQRRGDAATAADQLQDLIDTPVADEMSPALLEWLARYRGEAAPPDPDKALAAARALIRAAADPAWLQIGWYLAGEAHLSGGQREAAIEAFGQAYDQQAHTREKAVSALRLGELSLEDGHPADAEDRFRAAADLASDPDLVDLRARGYFGLARVAAARDDGEEAARRYLSVGILFDDADLTPHALYEAARILDRLGRKGDRDRTADELRSRYPNSPWTEKLESETSNAQRPTSNAQRPTPDT